MKKYKDEINNNSYLSDMIGYSIWDGLNIETQIQILDQINTLDSHFSNLHSSLSN